MLTTIIRLIFTLLGAVGGAELANLYQISIPGPSFFGIILYIIIGAGIGYFIGGVVGIQTAKGLNWMEQTIQKVPLLDIIVGVAGLIVGLILATLVSLPLWKIPVFGPYLAMLIFVILGYLGTWLGLRKKEDISSNFKFLSQSKIHGKKFIPLKKILDTSVIIDGRIVDICRTGFISGELIVPAFVLKELQAIADSEDSLKRSKGRRGLDVLHELREEPNVKVKIVEKDYPKISNVDAKLVQMGKDMGLPLVTNDFNLNKVAGLYNVVVLNINELANALKPVVLPGEEINIYVIKKGKEVGQGIGYLNDGTMVVIEGGNVNIGQEIKVLVTSALQTSAGRMIFAKPKVGGESKTEGR
ncbi:TRAM domain-containing protein [Candidatus Oleimmundimicrobium sp.]|uniref:PIN/TRAM domain-containing protein n=1 Tax=Candidatus Oleimmundimicrobium sp. TaxID=3060597 RepID=UPI00271FF480|nr:TRAM domain-containing protein [Candidatus Oleimmundimicrobium sp.]MDO8885980.1 TRAM domain-containing protein [Candidatus Oleimmundimicrobium sp.]